MLLQAVVSVSGPERTARFLAHVTGGEALVCPPFTDSWIVFGSGDDARAIEIYPAKSAGNPDTVVTGRPSRTHLSVISALPAAEIEQQARGEGWRVRRCLRGKCLCLEVRIDSRLLVNVFDAGVTAH